MKKICFITGTRADYGIMAPVMRIIKESPEVELQIIATNMHLSPAYGMTVNEISDAGFHVDYKIDSLVEGGTNESTVESMARVQSGMAKVLMELKPDLIVILGDRFEALAAASSAVVFGVPVVHLHGGETTEGAFDDMFRNATTKLSTYHFASTPQYAEKIISMGENPDNVYHSGAPGAEILVDDDIETTQKFSEKTGFSPQEKFIILAMHPATLDENNGLKDVEATISALDLFINQEYRILVTMPNADPGNMEIRQRLKEWENQNPSSVVCVESLGSKLFRYAMSKASAIVVNSSAALIEAPTLRLPAINVGIRQKGRCQGPSVINSPGEISKIREAVSRGLSKEFNENLNKMPIEEVNPYYKKDSANFIANRLKTILKP